MSTRCRIKGESRPRLSGNAVVDGLPKGDDVEKLTLFHHVLPSNWDDHSISFFSGNMNDGTEDMEDHGSSELGWKRTDTVNGPYFEALNQLGDFSGIRW